MSVYCCNNGVDFDVLHENNAIKIISDKKEYTLEFDEYRTVVLDFADRVETFFSDSPPRIILEDEPDHSGYIAFWNEWKRIKPAVQSVSFKGFVLQEIDFSNEISIGDK